MGLNPNYLRSSICHRIDDLSGFKLSWGEDDLFVHVCELRQAIIVNVAVLHLQHPGYGPPALRPERDVANDRMHGVSVKECRELGIVDAASRADCRLHDLQVGITPGGHVVTERVSAYGNRPGLIFGQKLRDAWKLHGPG